MKRISANSLQTKIMHSLVSFGLFVLASGSAISQETGSVTFGECIKKAREFHPYFADKQKIEDTRLLKIKNLNTSWLPQMNLNAQATYQSEATQIDIPAFNLHKGASLDQYKANLDINQVIYDGGITSAQKKVTQASLDADLQQNETDIYKVTDQVSNVYFYTLLLQVNRDLYKNTLDDLNSKELKISSGVRNGILMESDLNNLKVEILKTRQLLNDLELSYNNSLQVLSELTGDSTLVNKKLEIPEFTVIKADSVNRPELRLFDLQKNILEGSKSISSSQRMPKLYAFSQLGYGRPGLNMMVDDFKSYYIVGIKLQWNIWDWSKASREKEIYSIQQNMVDSKKESYMRNLNISGKNELTKLKQLEQTLSTDQEILDLRKSISLQTEKRLEQGMVTMTDYLTEYNAQVKAGLQLETHKIQLIQSKANLLIINGLL